MKRVENKFTPLDNATYTMYASEATVRYAATGKIGVNLRLKVNDLDETGNPQKNAGRSIFNTYWLHPDAENLVSFYCGFLDALGFKLDDEGEYLLEDGTRMPDVMAMKDGTNGPEWVFAKGDVLPWLVGVPFVATTKHSVNSYENKQTGQTTENDQYRLGFRYENKRPVVSVHPRKTDVFVAPKPIADGPVVEGSETAETPFGSTKW